MIWKFGGTDLTSIGVITMLDDPLDLPDKRGKNQMIPFQHGTNHVNKYYDERVLMFGLTVSGTTVDEMEGKMDTLRLLLSQRRVLSKTLTSGAIYTVNASVEKKMQVRREAPYIAKMVIEFQLSEPFFRLSTLIADNTTTINSSPKAMTVTNPGNIQETNPILTLTGPLTNPVITNSTNGVVMSYTGAIAGGTNVVIVRTNGEYHATHSADGEVIGNVTHSGNPAFMVFEPGDNTLSITSDVATTGTVKASFYPPSV